MFIIMSNMKYYIHNCAESNAILNVLIQPKVTNLKEIFNAHFILSNFIVEFQ